jgi:chromosome segregation ATPase
MAKGITQEQVDGAIDQLVAAGERPTIERIRATLGTGSPNTVNRMLDAWWAGLSTRLAAQQAKVLVPDAPAAVTKAATDLWVAALAQARAEADRETDSLVVDFTRMRESLAARRQEVDALLESHIAAAKAAQQAQQLAEARLTELQRLLDAQARQLTDVQRRYDHAIEEQAAVTAKLEAARAALAGAQENAATERDALQAHLRQVEERAYGEVDRLRQETKALKAQLAAQAREHIAALRVVELARRAAEAAQHAAERDSAAAQSRAQVLERQRATSAAKKPTAPARRRAAKA